MHGLTTYSKKEFSETIPASLKIWMPTYKSSLSLMCLGDTYGAGRHVGAARTGVGIMQAWVLPGMYDLNRRMFTDTVCHIVVSFYLSNRVVRFSSAFSTHEGYTTAASSITNIPVFIDSNLSIF